MVFVVYLFYFFGDFGLKIRGTKNTKGRMWVSDGYSYFISIHDVIGGLVLSEGIANKPVIVRNLIFFVY